MHLKRTGLVLAVCLAATSAAFAAPAPAQAAKVAKAKTASSANATHSAKGVVKAIDQKTLVVERGQGTDKKDMTFALDSSTIRGGNIAAGSMVAVRYKTDGAKLMAVSVEPTKVAAASKTAK